MTEPMTDDLRRLAEAARVETYAPAWDRFDWDYPPSKLAASIAAFLRAASPDRILALLATLDAERARSTALAEALRECALDLGLCDLGPAIARRPEREVMTPPRSPC